MILSCNTPSPQSDYDCRSFLVSRQTYTSPRTLLNFSLDRQEKNENSFISVLKLWAAKMCALWSLLAFYGAILNAQLLLLLLRLNTNPCAVFQRVSDNPICSSQISPLLQMADITGKARLRASSTHASDSWLGTLTFCWVMHDRFEWLWESDWDLIPTAMGMTR